MLAIVSVTQLSAIILRAFCSILSLYRELLIKWVVNINLCLDSFLQLASSLITSAVKPMQKPLSFTHKYLTTVPLLCQTPSWLTVVNSYVIFGVQVMNSFISKPLEIISLPSVGCFGGGSLFFQYYDFIFAFLMQISKSLKRQTSSYGRCGTSSLSSWWCSPESPRPWKGRRQCLRLQCLRKARVNPAPEPSRF